jgi:uncharacterized protein (DUF433 family)
MTSPDSNVVVAAFTEDQTARLTGVSKRQLRYWDPDFFAPSFANSDRSLSFSRMYSFRDLVCLKILNALRNETRVPLPHLRDVKDRLSHLGEDMWAKTVLYVLNRKVVFRNPETDAKEEIVSGQAVLEIPLIVASGDMQSAVKALWRRDDASIGKIQRQRSVAHNQAVIAGTRIPVRSVKAFADAGYSIEQIQKEYPTLTEDDIRAALAYEAAA